MPACIFLIMALLLKLDTGHWHWCVICLAAICYAPIHIYYKAHAAPLVREVWHCPPPRPQNTGPEA